MKGTIFLAVVVAAFAMSPSVFSQTGRPAQQPSKLPTKIEPRPKLGKGPDTPKELPDAKLAITNLAYVDTLPGARITIKNVGGKTSTTGMLVISLYAAEKKGGSWPNISGLNPFQHGYPEVWCPYNGKSMGTGFLAFGQPTLNGRLKIPSMKGGETTIFNLKFDEYQGGKVNIKSLVDFATHNTCGPYSLGTKSMLDFKYFVSAYVMTYDLKTQVHENVYLHQ